MNPEEQQSRLEKIRALLAKAEATKFPEEAKVFAAKAQELMTKWSIDEAMLGASRGDDGASTIERMAIWLDANEYRAPKVALLSAVARANDCKIVWFKQTYRVIDGKPKRQFMVEVIGTEADRRFVEILYTSLTLQVEHELLSDAVIAQMELECDEGGHRIKWRNTFVNGYAAGIEIRLQEAKKRQVDQEQAKYHGASVALVLIGKMAVVERRFAEFYPKCKTSKGSSAGQGSHAASRMGYEASKRADVGSPKVAAQKRRMIGE